MLGSQLQKQAQQCVQRVAAGRVVCRPQPVVARSKTVHVSATTKAPAQPVRIKIEGRRLPVTDAIKQYVEEKITKAVHNYTHNIKKVDVTLSARGGDTGTRGAKQQKVDVTITTMRSGVVRVEDAEENLYASIDLVCDKVARKLQKLKERMISQGNWPGRAGPRVNTEEEDFKEYLDNLLVETMIKSYSEEEMRDVELSVPQAGLPDTVVRSKVVNCDPMTTQEAIEAMEAVGHDFYMFRDLQSKGIQVVYKRQSGGYGILVPQ